MGETLRRDLYEAYSHFYETNNFREKAFILGSLMELLDIFPGDRNLVNIYNNLSLNFEKHYYRVQEIILDKQNEYNEFVKQNGAFIQKMIPMNKEVDTSLDLAYYEKENLMSILYDFLESISPDLANFFENMVNNNRIYIGNENCYPLKTLLSYHYNGFVGMLGGKKINSYIYTNHLNDLGDLLVLVHEIGHAYYIFLNKINFQYFNDNNQMIKNEIPAKMMEILFIRYLIKKGLREEAKMLMKCFNIRISKDKMSNNAFYNLQYSVGSFVGSQYADIIDDYKVEDIFRFIYQSDFHFLLQRSSIHFDSFAFYNIEKKL